MKTGDYIYTPRFCTVRIEAILSGEEAREKGYVEPTYYEDDPQYAIYGKHIGTNRMEFAAVEK